MLDVVTCARAVHPANMHAKERRTVVDWMQTLMTPPCIWPDNHGEERLTAASGIWSNSYHPRDSQSRRMPPDYQMCSGARDSIVWISYASLQTTAACGISAANAA